MTAIPQRVDMALAQGWSVIPCRKDKRPCVSWKRFQQTRPTEAEIRSWVAQYQPDCWGVVTGTVSGVCVIDFDGEAGKTTCERLGLKPHVQTGSGGYHVYIEAPSWHTSCVNGKSKRDLGRRFPGMDFRGTGGYAVFAGNNEKGTYGWVRPMKPESKQADGAMDAADPFGSETRVPDLPCFSRLEQVPEAMILGLNEKLTHPGAMA